MRQRDRISIRHVRPSLKLAIKLYAHSQEPPVTEEKAILMALSVVFREWEEKIKYMQEDGK